MIKINSLIRSTRRTLMLQINEHGNLIVRAPMKMSLSTIESFIKRKSRWIIEKQNLMQNAITMAPKKNFVVGENFLYLGYEYPLKVTDSSKIQLNGFLELPHKMVPLAKEFITLWYKREALIFFTNRVDFHSKITGLKHCGIKITSAKKRWGSCTATNKLNFTWRLIMAPLEIIDYVILHELVHIVEKNHSQHFWKKLEKVLPSYKVHKRWLQKNGTLLNI